MSEFEVMKPIGWVVSSGDKRTAVDGNPAWPERRVFAGVRVVDLPCYATARSTPSPPPPARLIERAVELRTGAGTLPTAALSFDLLGDLLRAARAGHGANGPAGPDGPRRRRARIRDCAPDLLSLVTRLNGTQGGTAPPKRKGQVRGLCP